MRSASDDDDRRPGPIAGSGARRGVDRRQDAREPQAQGPVAPDGNRVVALGATLGQKPGGRRGGSDHRAVGGRGRKRPGDDHEQRESQENQPRSTVGAAHGTTPEGA